MNERYLREKQFFNRESEEDARARVAKYYGIFGSRDKFYQNLVISYCPGCRVLEYGCGEGEWACLLAERGASVTGFDLSDVRIEVAREKARLKHLDNTRFLVANAEALDFDDATFDVVCGTAIIHHLDLRKAFSEIARVLRPGGVAVFMEPLGHNPLINLYRKLTPRLRTEDEHPLRTKDIELARSYFEVDLRSFGLLSLAAVLFSNTYYFSCLTKFLDAADSFLFKRVPFLRKHAWYCVMVLTLPKQG